MISTKDGVAFFGLGTMGGPMAHRLREAGHPLVVLESSATASKLVSRGARAVRSPAVAVRDVEVVVLSLPDSRAINSLFYGDGDLLRSISPGGLVIDMGTSDPEATRRLSTDLGALEVDFLDAPVSGGPQAASTGTLSCMVGGTKETFNRATPLLQTLAANVTYVGPAGTGQTMKLINNMIGLGNLGVLCEALAVAERLGLDLELAMEIFSRGSADSRALQFWGKRLVRRDYDAPAYRFNLALKDVELVHELTSTTGLPAPFFDALRLSFLFAAGQGASSADVSAIKSIWDNLAR